VTGHSGEPTETSGPDQTPWWHDEPDQPPVDSVLTEGLKLAAALRDWAVQSGAAAAVAEVAQTAANGATTYLAAAVAQGEPARGDGQQVVRCADCPVCQGLDALDRSNPQMAQAARSALSQVNTLLAGLLGGEAGPGRAKQ
jgi:hypothetical protein